MRSSTRTAAALLILTLGAEAVGLAKVGSSDAAYFGGTANVFSQATSPVGGHLDTTSHDALAFSATDKAFAGRALTIPYANITNIEYGQKAGRRVGASIGYSLVVGPAGLLALLSKKRHHYMTIGYRATDGSDQVAVFEIGKGIIRTTLAVVETRSGKRVLFEHDLRRAETW